MDSCLIIGDQSVVSINKFKNFYKFDYTSNSASANNRMDTNITLKTYYTVSNIQIKI